MMLLRTAAHTGATASCRSQLRPDPGSEEQRPTVCPTAAGRAIVSTRREPAMPMRRLSRQLLSGGPLLGHEGADRPLGRPDDRVKPAVEARP